MLLKCNLCSRREPKTIAAATRASASMKNGFMLGLGLSTSPSVFDKFRNLRPGRHDEINCQREEQHIPVHTDPISLYAGGEKVAAGNVVRVFVGNRAESEDYATEVDDLDVVL